MPRRPFLLLLDTVPTVDPRSPGMMVLSFFYQQNMVVHGFKVVQKFGHPPEMDQFVFESVLHGTFLPKMARPFLGNPGPPKKKKKKKKKGK